MQSISIIGIGRLGGALALALDEKKYKIENLIAKNKSKAEKIARAMSRQPEISTLEEIKKINSDAVFICTQDSAISDVARILPEKLKKTAMIFHVSGALSSDILRDLHLRGFSVGSVHPLVSISDSFLGAARFRDAYFAIEGEEKSRRFAETFVRDLVGKPFSIETKYKTLYHAAAVTACGHLVALFDAAIEMLSECGLEKEQAKRILQPLVKSTIENLETQTPAEALTGTFARADYETFIKHIEMIKEHVSPEILAIYLLLGEKSLNLAENRITNKENLEKIRRAILIAKKNFK